MNDSYDAILVVSFGGPEGPDDVLPFLENVLRGKNVPRERMLEVAKHYQQFGGVSPINEQNRALINALEQELVEHGPDLPIFWGNRNWAPLLPDTLLQMKQAGVKRALAFFTSTFSSYSGCRQYREDIQRAQEQVGAGAPEVEKLRVFFNHPGFIEATVLRTQEALDQIPEERRDKAVILYSAHSIPLTMASGCRYEAQLQESSRLVSDQLAGHPWHLVYQSRSGPPHQPWLEPDICDYIKALGSQGDIQDLVIVPIGFVSDHMEVLFDLDTEAKDVGRELGINVVRAKTVGVHPRFIRMIRELIEERIGGDKERPALGDMGASHDVCPVDCCLRTTEASR
ncbi:ferrochelatase [uncultured Gimesia sp.]|uniref:ferrochelatase n=1 Tax=uncultured Gimesia sp. TaxID=1678688 RepID=UPI0026176FA2|nr:ferrochelatase [uncultured Gimesia sp.]